MFFCLDFLLFCVVAVAFSVDQVNVNLKRTAPGSLLENEKVWHHPNLLNQNLCFNKKFMGHTQVTFRETLV